MFAIELKFPAGRYHATPWGRNVNEGEVEWPPSPFRLARAVLAAAYRRHPQWSEERVTACIALLGSAPRFWLPRATASHYRSYYASDKKADHEKPQKIFDAFVALEAHDRVVMGFDGDPDPEPLQDLDRLLRDLDYLGRSESWVRARVVEPPDGRPQVVPRLGHPQRRGTERVRLACLRGPEAYPPAGKVPERKVDRGRKGTTEPLGWIQAVALSTGELNEAGWSHPPGLLWVDYDRPQDLLVPTLARAGGPAVRVRRARYALVGSVLPRVEDTLRVAERVRSLLMGIHKRLEGGDPRRVSPRFSGKAPGGGPGRGHDHVYVLPLDEDGDGRLDHLEVWCREPLEGNEVMALDRLTLVPTWGQRKNRPDVHVVLLSLAEHPEAPRSRKWVSVTPFTIRRHHKKSRGPYLAWLAAEVRREAVNHGFPEPVEVRFLDRAQPPDRPVRWWEFARSRKGGRPPRGHGCQITFAQDVSGPMALGALAHFGLGRFRPV